MPPRPWGRDEFRGRVVLVLGAGGFIGRWVVRVLERQGAVVHRTMRAPGVASERVYAIDLSLADCVERLVEQVRPEIIFNLAGYGINRSETDEATAYQINDQLVGTLARAVAQLGNPPSKLRTIVHVGSALEYGLSGGDLVESTTPRPTTLYGQSKLAGTMRLMECCHRFGMNGLTARLFSVYGPGERRERLLPTLINSKATHSPILLTDGTQLRDFTYVADAAEGLARLALCQEVPGEVVNLGTGYLQSVRSFVDRAAEIIGLERSRLKFGALPRRPEEMNHGPISIARLRALTGWAPPTTVDEGIHQTLTTIQLNP